MMLSSVLGPGRPVDCEVEGVVGTKVGPLTSPAALARSRDIQMLRVAGFARLRRHMRFCAAQRGRYGLYLEADIAANR